MLGVLRSYDGLIQPLHPVEFLEGESVLIKGVADVRSNFALNLLLLGGLDRLDLLNFLLVLGCPAQLLEDHGAPPEPLLPLLFVHFLLVGVAAEDLHLIVDFKIALRVLPALLRLLILEELSEHLLLLLSLLLSNHRVQFVLQS